MQFHSRRLAVVVLLFIGLLAPAFSLFDKHVSAASRIEQPIIARVTIKSQQELERFVRLGLDLLEMREGDDLFILTTQAQVEWLREQGWTVTVDTKQTATLSLSSQPGTNIYMAGYRTVVEMRAFLNEKAVAYPNLAEVFVYGSSWEKVNSGGAAGHDLFGIKLTNKQRPGPKPRFFLMTAIHARELATSEVALRFIDYLLNGYGVDGDATWLLDEHEIIVVPVVNPDGRVIAEQGFQQRKNTNYTYGGNCLNPPTYYDQIGVDLNRNSSFKWGTVNTPNEPQCGQTYPGPFAASEPETAALENLVRSLFPDQRGPLDTDAAPMTTTGVLISLHSYGDLVLWPWGHTGAPAPNATELSLIGRKFASYNGYTPHQSIGLYPTSGTTDDWSYGELGIASYTFELGPSSGQCGGFFPAFSCLDGGTGGGFWPRNLGALLYAARIARAPYQLVHGPTPDSYTATVTASDHVQLQALFNEQGNGAQAITAAEYYIDTPPWRNGTPIPMSPSDGNFNGINETANASVGPIYGRHQFYARARDANGNWGPVKGAIAVTTAAAPPTLQIEFSSYNFSENAGHASVNITRSGDTSAPASVHYASTDSAGLNNCNVLNGHASSRCDYTTSVGIISFAAGDTTAKSITIPLVDDAYMEGQESFTLSLSNPSGASLGSVSTTSIKIIDNEVSNGANPIDGTAFFVRQHYIDFLNREPEEPFFTDWQNLINNCPAGSISCDRIEVSSGFFRSQEFRERGYFPYRFYLVSLGRKPDYAEFMPDLARVSGFFTDAEKEQAKQAFITEFMARAEFAGLYNSLSNNAYVQRLYETAGVTQVTVGGTVYSVSAMQQLMATQNKTRAEVLREIVESPEVDAKYYTQAFVVMQYFGYLRRDPDALYEQLIDEMNANPENYRQMVNIFVNSQEYRARFGP